MAVEGHQAAGRRGHAGVHELAVARLLRDDGHSAARRTRLHPRRREGAGATVAIVNRRFADHFFPARARVGKHVGFGTGPKSKLDIEIIGVVANSLYEGPREGVRRQVFIPHWGRNSATVLRADHQRVLDGVLRSCATRCRQLDASMPVYEMKTLEAQLDETLLTRPLDRAAGGRVRPARDACWRRSVSTA